MKIALVHYSFPPVAGGVEKIVQAHARELAARGYAVKVVCGEGASPSHAAYEVVVLPGLKAQSTESRRATLKPQLLSALKDCEVVICHNLLTMPFNPDATRALTGLASNELKTTRFIHWTHDIAATNPDYLHDPRVHCENAEIARYHAGFEYVCISEERLHQLATLEGYDAARTSVIPNGFDPWEIAGVPEHLKNLLNQRGIFEKEIVLFHPARLLPRKRIEISVGIAGALRDKGISVLLIVSGAPDPHQTRTIDYANELQRLVASLHLESEVVFAGAESVLSDNAIAACYRLCDAVVFPSAHEGFGLPVLEACAHGKLLIASEIPTTRSHVCGETVWLHQGDSCQEIATSLVEALDRSAVWRARRKVIEQFSWDGIIPKYLQPLLRANSDE